MSKRPKPFYTEIIASPEDFTPSSPEMKIVGAFNPGVTTIQTQNGLETLLMIRVAEKYKGNERDYIHLPFFDIPNEEGVPPVIRFDIYKRKNVKVNKKDVKLPSDNGGERTNRLRHISLPRIMRLDEKGIIKREQKPALYPTWEYERFGMEDFRITHMDDGRYILTYVVPHRGFGVSTSILETKDFENYERLTKRNTPRPIKTGIKDIVIFPEKVSSPESTETIREGEKIYAALIRPNAFANLSVPGIWTSYSPDLIHWGQEHRLTEEKIMAGTGSPPIKLGNIWLAPYHETTRLNKTQVKYDTKLMSVNAEKPWENFHSSDVLLTRSDYSEIPPGYVPNVVFTSGMIEKDGKTSLFQGIDDTCTVQNDFYTEDLIKFVNGK